jgi:hypothetical protein
VRVDWAIPCRYAEVHDNLATIVGGGIDHTLVPVLPAPVQVVLAIRLVFLPDEDELTSAHKLRVAALSPEGETLAQVEGDINLAGGAPPPAGDWLQALHVPMAIQFMAQTEGRYTLEITVDGHTLGIPMTVVTGLPPGAGPPTPPGPAE